jgi:hypothetical protein
VTALWFLLAAVAISAIGSLILVLRYRSPSNTDWSIEEFRREMQALAPEQQRGRPVRRADPPSNRSNEREF